MPLGWRWPRRCPRLGRPGRCRPAAEAGPAGAQPGQWIGFFQTAHNQQWTAVPAPVGGGYAFLVARYSGKCLAILSESLKVGADMVQDACSPYCWVIDPIGGSS